PPEVPGFLVGHLAVAVEGEMDLVHTAGRLDDRHDLVAVFLAEGVEDRAHDFLDECELVLRHVIDTEARLLVARLAEAHRRQALAGGAIDDGAITLFAVEGVEDAEHGLGLVIEAVARAVAVRAVAVVDGPAEGRARLGVAVAADGEVMAREDPGPLLL